MGPPDIAPKSCLLKRSKMVLSPFHRSHREICTRNRPVSEMKFPDDFWGPLSLPAPFLHWVDNFVLLPRQLGSLISVPLLSRGSTFWVVRRLAGSSF